MVSNTDPLSDPHQFSSLSFLLGIRLFLGIECRVLEGPAAKQHKVFKPENLEMAAVATSKGSAPTGDGGAAKRRRQAHDLFGMGKGDDDGESLVVVPPPKRSSAASSGNSGAASASSTG